MTRFPRMLQNHKGTTLVKESRRHLPQTQSCESFRLRKRLSKTSASGGMLRAVMTVEAAISFSLFLLLLSLFFTFYQEQAISLRAEQALDEVCRSVAEWSYAVAFAEKYTGTDIMSLTDGSTLAAAPDLAEGFLGLLDGRHDLVQEVKAFLAQKASAVLWQAVLKEIVAGKIGEDRLKAAGVEGGAAGLSLSGSTLQGRDLDLILSFRVASRIGFPFRLHIPVTVRSARRLWIGTVSLKPETQSEETGEDDGTEEETIVYVTASGTVYHRTVSCRVLNIRPVAVPAQEVGTYRNSSGGKYYPCDYCCGGKTVKEGIVYLTDDGIRYHKNRDCGEISRYVRKMALSEAEQSYRPCYYCGKEAG